MVAQTDSIQTCAYACANYSFDHLRTPSPSIHAFPSILLALAVTTPPLPRFDITAALAAGGQRLEHTLCLRVYRFCDGSYLEDQDMWWLSGVTRDVVVYSKPSDVYICDYSVRTNLLPHTSGQAPDRGELPSWSLGFRQMQTPVPLSCRRSAPELVTFA